MSTYSPIELHLLDDEVEAKISRHLSRHLSRFSQHQSRNGFEPSLIVCLRLPNELDSSVVAMGCCSN